MRLPGNLLIEQNLIQCIEKGMIYSVGYLNIDNFKSYNDEYGFENGDMIIKLLANILRVNLPDDQFVGHIGGDDFIVILDNYVDEDYFDDIVQQFEREALNFYNKGDIENGYILTNNRQGNLEKFPLISVTAVSINNKTRDFKNIYELTKYLTRLKSEKKSKRKFN